MPILFLKKLIDWNDPSQATPAHNRIKNRVEQLEKQKKQAEKKLD